MTRSGDTEAVQARPDEVDVTLAANGDARAFHRLYLAHVGRVHGLAWRMTGSDEAAEITQDVFVRAWQKLSTFRGEAAFGTWLHRLAVNVILAHRARAATERERHDDGEDVLEGIRAPASNPGIGVDFESAIARLPAGARRVFVLHDVEGYKHQEIAGMLGITTGTSKSQLHRARMARRAHLAG